MWPREISVLPPGHRHADWPGARLASAKATPGHATSVEVPRRRTRHAASWLPSAYAVAALLAVAPIVAALALRLPLVNQLNYADGWFYSAYAWVPKHHFAIFGWNYFSVRFPAILSIGTFERLFGPGDGYVLLRYVLAVLSGASVYLCVRRFASRPVATVAALLLYLNPFFSRMLLWDYSGFLEVAGGVIGVALWYWSERRRLVWTLLPGIALSCAVFANAFVATALIVLLLVEALAALRQGQAAVRSYIARLGVLAGAAVCVFAVGYLSYLAVLGSLSPLDLIRPTVKFFGENAKQSAPYQRPVSTWLFHELRIWAPVVTSLGLVAVLRGRILGPDLTARIAQFCVAYTGFLWLYRFLVTSSVVETWWAYSVVVVAMAPAVGLLVHEVTRAPWSRRWAVIALAALITPTLLLRNLTVPARDVYHAIATHEALLVGILATGVVGALLLGTRRAALRGSSVAVLAIVTVTMLYAPSILDGRGTTGIFVRSGSEEWHAYDAAFRFVDLVRHYDSKAHRVFLWFPGTLGYVSITWADLPQDADTLNQVGVSESLGNLTPLAMARLRQPEVKYVMVLAPQAGELTTARTALVRGGFGGEVVRQGDLADRKLSFALLRLAKAS